MQYLELNSGAKIPAIGLGTWLATESVTQAVIEAINIGYRHIDCAAIYKNESIIGTALQTVLQSTLPREDLWLTSKLWNSFHKPDDVRPACLQTLKDLNVDYLDLYLMHWPVAFKNIGLTVPDNSDDFLALEKCPLGETFAAMQELVTEGLVKNIGVSNFSISKIDDLISATGITPSVNQIECHPYLTQPKLHKYCNEKNIRITAYSPLGTGFNPEKMQSDELALIQDPVITEIAQKNQVSPAQVLLAWSLAHGNIVIPKSVTKSRIVENFAAQNVQLNSADIAAIDSLNKNHRYFSGTSFYQAGSPYTFESIWG